MRKGALSAEVRLDKYGTVSSLPAPPMVPLYEGARMRPWSRLLCLLSTAVVAAGLAGAAPAASAAPARPSASGAAPRAVTLITGDVVTLGAGARPAVAVLPRSRAGAAGAFRTASSGGSVSVIPLVAVPY